MATVATDLLVQIDASTEALRRELRRADKAVATTAASMNKNAAQASTAFNRAGAAGGRFTKVFTGPLGNRIQNVGFQISDFTTQVTGGTSAMVAFSQQAPQLLGAFGPQGALLGVVAGVAGGLAVALWNARDAAEGAAGGADALQKAFSDMHSQTADLRDITKEYREQIQSTARDQSAATDSIIADTRRELEARKVLVRQDIETAMSAHKAELRRIKGLQEELRTRKELERFAASDMPSAVGAANALRERRAGQSDAELRREIERAKAEAVIRDIELTNQVEALENARIATTSARVPPFLNPNPLDDTDGGSGGGRSGSSRTSERRDGPASLDTGFSGWETINSPGYQMRRRFEDHLNAQEELSKSALFTANTLGQAAESAILAGDGLRGFVQAFGRSVQQSVVGTAANMFGNAVTGAVFGGLTGSALPSGSGITFGSVEAVPGFATGGLARVAGSGSTDSKLVSFRASPGELVSVQQPGRAGGDGAPNITYQIDARGADQGAVQRLEAALREHVGNHRSYVARDVKQARAERTLDRGGRRR